MFVLILSYANVTTVWLEVMQLAFKSSNSCCLIYLLVYPRIVSQKTLSYKEVKSNSLKEYFKNAILFVFKRIAQ